MHRPSLTACPGLASPLPSAAPLRGGRAPFPPLSSPGRVMHPEPQALLKAARRAQHACCSGAAGGGGSGSAATGADIGMPSGASCESVVPPPLPPVVNFHLEARCNYACKFCFATFEDVKAAVGAGSAAGAEPAHPGLAPSSEQLLAVPALLAAQGVSRISFVGGEPLLHPLIFDLVAAAKAAGLAASMVTNASLLGASALLRLAGSLDWLALSVDASSDELHAAVGRGVRGEVAAGRSAHLARVRMAWGLARELGFRLKLNTVVTRAMLQDDMAPLVAELQPERWKVFQVLPIEGQNDGSVEPLLVSTPEFDAWVDRQRAGLAAVGAACVPLVAEGNAEMQGSYAMLDAGCRFFSNASGRHVYGPGIFELSPDGDVAGAWAGVASGFSPAKFGARGGVYEWGQGEERVAEQLQQWGWPAPARGGP